MVTRNSSRRAERFLARLGMLTTVLLLFSPSLADGTWTPDARMLAALESQVRTPAGAPDSIHPMADYARFYLGVMIKGQRMVRGELVLAPRECSAPHRDVGLLCEYRAGLYVNQPLPSIFDGGCEIVNLLYDPAAGRIVWLRCNGVA